MAATAVLRQGGGGALQDGRRGSGHGRGVRDEDDAGRGGTGQQPWVPAPPPEIAAEPPRQHELRDDQAGVDQLRCLAGELRLAGRGCPGAGLGMAQGQPRVGIPARPRRTGRPGLQGGALNGVADPQGRGHRPGTPAVPADLAGVPERPREDHPWRQTSFMSTRSSCAACTCCSSSSTAPGRYTWSDHGSPDGGAGDPAGPQPANEPWRSRGRLQVPIRDSAAKFAAAFDAMFTAVGARIIKTPVRAAERLCRTLGAQHRPRSPTGC
jgi:hypothetical protein